MPSNTGEDPTWLGLRRLPVRGMASSETSGSPIHGSADSKKEKAASVKVSLSSLYVYQKCRVFVTVSVPTVPKLPYVADTVFSATVSERRGF